MKKLLKFLSVFIFMSTSIRVAGFSETDNQTISYNFHGVEFKVPLEWESRNGDDENTYYFVLQDGQVTFNYHNKGSVASEVARETIKKELKEGQAIIENEQLVQNDNGYSKGYLYDFQLTIDSMVYEGDFLLFDHKEGFISVVFMTSNQSAVDYTKEYKKIISSMGYSFSEENKTTNDGPFNESDYDEAYEVRFQDYAIYYLVSEKNKTITILTSDAPQTEYVSSYTGDFNNGVNFDWNGLKMRAHYKYWNNSSSIIVYDESGNENYAPSTTSVSTVVDLLNRSHQLISKPVELSLVQSS